MKEGYFGEFGGRFSPELLMPPLLEVEDAYKTIAKSKPFLQEFGHILAEYVGRSTPLTLCPHLSEELGFHLYLKREDLAHTGAHKINNCIGQGLLAKHMGKHTLLAETGAGQHGVATATAAAYLGLKCIIFMGATDVERQAHNVRRMRLLGAEVHAVESGTKTLKDAINAAFRYWIANQEDTHYCFGTAAGPHPFPSLVRDFQSVIGHEARQQSVEIFGTLPDVVVACVGGGSNAIGIFSAFLDDREVRLVGVEAGGTGEPGCYHSAAIGKGTPGVFHGARTELLQTEDGQIEPSHSIAPGLDYPGVGPEHAWLNASGRAEYVTVYDDQALAAFKKLARSEGIIPALESAHAVAYVLEHKGDMEPGCNVIVNLSGRGDKDMDIVDKMLDD